MRVYPWSPPAPTRGERAYWFLYRIARRIFFLSEWRWRWRRVSGFFTRGARGWARQDVWGMSWYIAGVMSAMLRRLAEIDHGIPAPFMPDHEASDDEVWVARYRWTEWLLEKSDWLDWYARDDGTTGPTNWIDDDLTQEVRSERIAAHYERMRVFHEEVMPDLGKYWYCLWD